MRVSGRITSWGEYPDPRTPQFGRHLHVLLRIFFSQQDPFHETDTQTDLARLSREISVYFKG